MAKKILITGGAGFIGSNFTHFILNKYPDYKVTVLDKLTYAGSLENLQGALENPNFDFVRGDIVDKDFLDNLFKEKDSFDFVVHFAAESHVDRSIANPEIFVHTNIIGTHNLLHVSKKYGVEKYHQVSTDEVYGDLGEGSTNFFTESTPINPGCPYANTKAAADLLVQSYYRTYNFPAVITRCTNNYGPYQFPEKAIPLFMFAAIQGKPITLHGKGSHVRDWLYVIDHCEAIDLVLHNADIGEVYNIGGHNELSTKDLAYMILDFFGKDPETSIVYIPDRAANDMRYAMDPTKISGLGWSPKHTFKHGLKDMIKWYFDHQDWLYKIYNREIGASGKSKQEIENLFSIEDWKDKFNFGIEPGNI